MVNSYAKFQIPSTKFQPEIRDQKLETRNLLNGFQSRKNFFEDAAPVPNVGTFGRARKTKQSQIASFSALPTALCQLNLNTQTHFNLKT